MKIKKAFRKISDLALDAVLDSLFSDGPPEPVDCIYCETTNPPDDIRANFREGDDEPHCKKCGREIYLGELKRNILKANQALKLDSTVERLESFLRKIK